MEMLTMILHIGKELLDKGSRTQQDGHMLNAMGSFCKYELSTFHFSWL